MTKIGSSASASGWTSEATTPREREVERPHHLEHGPATVDALALGHVVVAADDRDLVIGAGDRAERALVDPLRQLRAGLKPDDGVAVGQRPELHAGTLARSRTKGAGSVLAAMALPELLERLLTTPGPSGQERAAAAVWREAAAPVGEVSSDVLGSSWVRVPGHGGRPVARGRRATSTRSRVVVTHLGDDGHRRGPAGRRLRPGRDGRPARRRPHAGRAAARRRRRRASRSGKPRRGAQAARVRRSRSSTSARRTATSCASLVRPGDAALWHGAPLALPGNRVASRAFDNRIGCYVALEVARRLAGAGGTPGDVDRGRRRAGGGRRLRGLAHGRVRHRAGRSRSRSTSRTRPTCAAAIRRTRARSPRRRPDAVARAVDPPGRSSSCSTRRRSRRRSRSRSRSRAARRTPTPTPSTSAARGIATGLVSVPLRYMHSPVEIARPRRHRAGGAAASSRSRAGSSPALELRWAKLERVSRSVIVSAVRTPFGKLSGGLAAYPATELGAIAIRAGLERIGLEGSEVDYVIMGQVLQAGAGQAPGAAGGGRRGDPDRRPVRHGEQGLRLVDPRGRDRRLDDPRRRRRGRRHRRDGVDDERAVRAAEGAQGLPDGRRDAGRPDDLGRAALDVRRDAHGAAGGRASPASSASRARSRTRGRSARTSAPRRRRTRAASTTRSSPSAR